MAKNKKHTLSTLISFGFALLAVVSFGTVNAIGVEGTKHDLTANANIDSGDIEGPCVYCHGAHGSESKPALWNRTKVATVFTLYASSTIPTVEQPGSLSLACLSCHDGTTAFDAINGSSGTVENNMNTIFPDSNSIIGHDLGDDHPIGVNIVSDSGGLWDEQTIIDAGIEIYNGRVECASCHEAHGSSGNHAFLRVDPTGSLLCLACHNK
jgi:predicted CXXCH cytochrome family protein